MTAHGRRATLLRLQDALRAESHHLVGRPEIVIQQLSNRLAQSGQSDAAVFEKQLATSAIERLWLRRSPDSDRRRSRVTRDIGTDRIAIRSERSEIIAIVPNGWQVLDLETGETLVDRSDSFRDTGLGQACDLAVAPGVEHFGVLHDSGEASLWSSTGELRARWKAPQDDSVTFNKDPRALSVPGAIALSPDGLVAILRRAFLRARLELWDPAGSELLSGTEVVDGVVDVLSGAFSEHHWRMWAAPLHVGFCMKGAAICAALPSLLAVWNWREKRWLYEQRFSLHDMTALYGPSLAQAATSSDSELVAFITSDADAWMTDLIGDPARLTRETGKAALAVSPLGDLIAIMREDGVLQVWDAAEGKLGDTYHAAHGSTIGRVSAGFSTAGNLVHGTYEGAFSVFQCGTPTDAADGAVHHETGSVLAVSTAGLMISRSFGRLAVRDFRTGQRVWEAVASRRAPVTCAQLLRSGEIVSGTADGLLQLFRPPAVDATHQADAGRGGITCLTASADGRIVVAGTDTGHCVLWRLHTNQHLVMPGAAGGVVSAIGLCSDRHVVVASRSGAACAVVDVERRSEVATLKGHTGVVTCIAASGELIATAGYDATVRVWDAKTFTPRGTAIVNDMSYDFLCFDNTGRYLLAADRTGTCQVIDAAALRAIATYPCDDPVPCAAMEDARIVLVTDRGAAIELTLMRNAEAAR